MQSMDWRDYIEQNPKVMVGKPVIKGTRITVEFILERLGIGWETATLLATFPDLKPESIQAAQAFAADYLRMEESIFRAS